MGTPYAFYSMGPIHFRWKEFKGGEPSVRERTGDGRRCRTLSRPPGMHYATVSLMHFLEKPKPTQTLSLMEKCVTVHSSMGPVAMSCIFCFPLWEEASGQLRSARPKRSIGVLLAPRVGIATHRLELAAHLPTHMPTDTHTHPLTHARAHTRTHAHTHKTTDQVPHAACARAAARRRIHHGLALQGL